ncbi:MerR family transcriptional regulator [Sinorhizobium saheli]|uniref:MerR family transcriptional regulator n=1 Tax=Sinorhizobium saheli TaxID=36856 RepID=A0A178YLZ0_SINSA|nr:helix-turn-helix domain-containing protein [Sinorhizobium saheli]MQW88330.1 MerR family transcriptional regulator [Sinorhizobium saheli]OAP48437.1 MerR family transcriptional regulator [Sinorhizobium saheli]
MLTIGELAKATGTNVSTIRYWEQTGLLAPSGRSEGNQRRYTEDEQDRLAFIRHARDLGLSVDAIRDLIDLSHRPDMPDTEADRIASEQLAEIREKIDRLKKLENELVQMSTRRVPLDGNKSRVIQALARFERPSTETE